MIKRTSLLFGLWWLLVAVAIFATQNPQPIGLNFLSWQSVPLPAGLVLVWLSGLSAFGFSLIWSRPIPRPRSSEPPQPNPRTQVRETQVRSKPIDPPRRRTPNPPLDDWEARTNDWDNW
ncbi:MAG: hypothetical protein SFT94_10120 [Pseudanabaenaceae cyanobacterium bins.68]|nr:hypothetical protein [Pseudanabaenaceae cyanobacterium bins.68]